MDENNQDDKVKKEEDKKKYSERFSRWQMKTLEERGKVISLLLSLSLATIGFIVNLIIKQEIHFTHCCSKTFIVIGIFLLLLCVVALLLLSINRLKDFRETTEIIKARKNSTPEAGIKKLKDENDKTGKLTLSWFNKTVYLFLLGELLIIGVLIVELFSLI